jgi:hypothetical protein
MNLMEGNRLDGSRMGMLVSGFYFFCRIVVSWERFLVWLFEFPPKPGEICQRIVFCGVPLILFSGAYCSLVCLSLWLGFFTSAKVEAMAGGARHY